MTNEIRPRVLLVDDESLFLILYSEYLSNGGFEVVCERSPIEAIKRISLGEKFDLMITDIVMIEMNGWDLIDQIRNKLKIDEITLPVIVISGYDSSAKEFDVLKHRANAFLIKKGSSVIELLRQANLLVGRQVTSKS